MEILFDYPQRIARVQHTLLRLDRRARKVQRALDCKTAEIEWAIAQDTELRNDQQRRARRLELTADLAYGALAETVMEYQDRRTRLEIQLQLLRDEFAVLKLRYRDEIASKEIASA